MPAWTHKPEDYNVGRVDSTEDTYRAGGAGGKVLLTRIVSDYRCPPMPKMFEAVLQSFLMGMICTILRRADTLEKLFADDFWTAVGKLTDIARYAGHLVQEPDGDNYRELLLVQPHTTCGKLYAEKPPMCGAFNSPKSFSRGGQLGSGVPAKHAGRAAYL